MRRRRFVRKKAEQRRKEKVSKVESVFTTFNNLTVSLPKMLSASDQTEKGLEEAETVLRDLGENQFPSLIKKAPYVGGVLALTSVLLARSIYKEIS